VPQVTRSSEILLNNVRYPLAAPPQRVLTSLYAPKVVTGDTTMSAEQRASSIAWRSWRGGLGIKKGVDATTIDRAWWSTCQLRFKETLVLPPLATQTAASDVGGSFSVNIIAELSDEIYASFGTAMKKYSETSDSWGSTLITFAGIPTDAITVRIEGTVYMIVCYTTGFAYTSTGTSWTVVVQPAKYMAFWNDQLWAIDNDGKLYASNNLTSWGEDAQLPLPSGSVTDLFQSLSADNEPILFASTTYGIYAHDADNIIFEPVRPKLPFHVYGGLGTVDWRDSIFYPAGLGVYQYKNGTNTATVSVVGPDRDHGVPDDKRGAIKQLVATHNELLALLDGTVGDPAALDMFDGSGMGTQITSTIGENIGYSSILAWDELGWECKWLSTDSTTAISHAIVSNSYGYYRLWWGQAGRVWYMPLEVDIINPDESTTLTFASSAEHITPWFDAQESHASKLALNLRVEVESASSDETVQVQYATNFDDSTYTTLGTITTSGLTEYIFPTSGTPTGTAFRAIRFRLALARGLTDTLSPNVTRLEFRYRKKLPAKWGFRVTVDTTQSYMGQTPGQMRDSLIEAVESNALVLFTYRDNDTSETYYVDAVNVSGFEYTGSDQRGQITMMLMEV